MAAGAVKRKVIRVGETSYAVIVPKQWCRDVGIRAGDYVNVERLRNSLLIYPEEPVDGVEGPSVVIDGGGAGRVCEEIRAAYVECAGEAVVNVRGGLVGEVVKCVRGLPGAVVLECGDGFVRVAFMSVNLGPKDVIRRVAELVASCLGDCLGACGGLVEDVEPLYRLGLRACRALMMRSLPRLAREAVDCMQALNYLREAAAYAQDLCRACGGVAGSPPVRRALQYLQEVFRLSVKSFVEGDGGLALTILSKVGGDGASNPTRWLGGVTPLVEARCGDLIRVCVGLARLALAGSVVRAAATARLKA